MTAHPTLAQQIKAVEWAAWHVAFCDEICLAESERNTIVAALDAAAEQLKTWDFAREALK